jgi:hypothetical protein
MLLNNILKDIEKIDEQDQNIILLNLLHNSKLFTESNKDNIVNILLNNKKEVLLEKTLFVSHINKVKQINSAKHITKIIDNLDEVCKLYEKIRSNERTTSHDFKVLINPIVDICKSNKCNLINNEGNHLLSVLLDYYTDNPILQGNSNYNDISLNYIIQLLLNNKNLIITCESLSRSLKTFYYDNTIESYNESVYKDVKDKLIYLNNLRSDKTICTFWDFYSDVEELITLLEDSYIDEDEEDEDEEDEDNTQIYESTIKFINLYEKMIKLFKSDLCNLKDDKGNTMLTHMLSKYYCDGFDGSIKYKGVEYSIGNLIKTLIHNEKFISNTKNSYNIDMLQMAKIIKRYSINYEEHDDIRQSIKHNNIDSTEDDELIKEISDIFNK